MFDVLGITAPFAFSPVSSSSPGWRQVRVGLEDPVYSSRAFQQQIPHFRDRHPGFLHGADEAADTGFSVTGRESSDEGFVLIWPTSSGYDSTAVVLCLIWSTSLGGWICPSASPVSDAGAEVPWARILLYARTSLGGAFGPRGVLAKTGLGVTCPSASPVCEAGALRGVVADPNDRPCNSAGSGVDGPS